MNEIEINLIRRDNWIIQFNDNNRAHEIVLPWFAEKGDALMIMDLILSRYIADSGVK